MMPSNLSLDSAADLLRWSNRIYVSGAILTLGSAAMVLYEKHSKNTGRAVRWALRTEIVVIVAAFISLAGTVGAISFGSLVSHLKDDELSQYEAHASVEVANANAVAATANQKADIAKARAEDVAHENLILQKSIIEITPAHRVIKDAAFAATSLRSVGNGMAVSLQVNITDNEPKTLSDQIADTLLAAGVDAKRGGLFGFASWSLTSIPGVHISTPSTPQAKALALRLEQLLSANRIKWDHAPASKVDSSPSASAAKYPRFDLYIWVGPAK